MSYIMPKHDPIGHILQRSERFGLNDDTVARLESKANRRIANEDREKLETIMDAHIGLYLLQEQSVEVKSVMARIEELKQAAETLYIFLSPGTFGPIKAHDEENSGNETVKCLHGRKPEDQTIETKLNHFQGWQEYGKGLKPIQFKTLITLLDTVYEDYVQRPLGKDGPNENRVLNSLLINLIDFYDALPKKPRKNGTGEKFFIIELMRLSEIQSHIRIHSDDALLERIKRLKKSSGHDQQE